MTNLMAMDNQELVEHLTWVSMIHALKPINGNEYLESLKNLLSVEREVLRRMSHDPDKVDVQD